MSKRKVKAAHREIRERVTQQMLVKKPYIKHPWLLGFSVAMFLCAVILVLIVHTKP